jgi:hypothetical protein
VIARPSHALRETPLRARESEARRSKNQQPLSNKDYELAYICIESSRSACFSLG